MYIVHSIVAGARILVNTAAEIPITTVELKLGMRFELVIARSDIPTSFQTKDDAII